MKPCPRPSDKKIASPLLDLSSTPTHFLKVGESGRMSTTTSHIVPETQVTHFPCPSCDVLKCMPRTTPLFEIEIFAATNCGTAINFESFK